MVLISTDRFSQLEARCTQLALKRLFAYDVQPRPGLRTKQPLNHDE